MFTPSFWEMRRSSKIVPVIPGVEEKDVEVTVSNDSVTIRGEKKEEKEDKDKTTITWKDPMAHFTG